MKTLNYSLILIAAFVFLYSNPLSGSTQKPVKRVEYPAKTDAKQKHPGVVTGNKKEKHSTPFNNEGKNSPSTSRNRNNSPVNQGSLTKKHAASNQKRNETRNYSSVNQNEKSRSNKANAKIKNEHNRNIYKIDGKDDRYAPGKNFRGNNLYWTGSTSKNYIHYSTKGNDYYYKQYDHRKHSHWDKNWETYRWNINSWKEYYNGYHPHSYRYNKFYYYHPTYGHVIKKFNYKPIHFVHNNEKYYNYNGHFFRAIKGVGYVLVDMPYGVVFHQMPSKFEKVYINGFLYFRVENLFFEMNPHGYALIHYPERYYALNIGYINGGYYVPGAFIFNNK